MKHLPRFAALLLTLALLAGCTPGEDPAVTPTPALSPTPAPTATAFSLPYDPAGSLHPLTVTASANLSLMSLLYEGLFAVNTRFEAEPVLCQSALPNEDATLWTLTVKPGVTCSDGTPVTGDLCRTSLLAAKASPLYAQRLQGISAITADGDRLAVSLSAPNRNLPALLDVPIFSGDKTPAGTGPYLLQETRLVARSDWWQGLSLPLDTIALVKAVSPEDLIYSFDAGDIALVTGDLTGINVLGYSGNYEVLDYPTSTMLYVGFNAAKGPCKSPALRSALT
ncbi:MAG: ABC transporter substrate-binding protein, partial [Oscillospiraceae bacterium]